MSGQHSKKSKQNKKISNHLIAGHATVGDALSERERFTGLAADGTGMRAEGEWSTPVVPVQTSLG